MRSFRGLRYFLAPPWLTGKGDGEKIAFTLEWLLDAFLERVRQGLNARFPTRAGESALNLITGDRGLLRGRDESREAHAARLKAWRTPRTHRVRGNAYEALLQVWHYWGGTYAATISSRGIRHEIQENGDTSRDTLDAWITLADLDFNAINETYCNWDDSNADIEWSRFWLVLQLPAALGVGPSPDFGDSALWGGALGTPGYLLGQTGVTVDDVTAMRALFQELKWNPAHAVPEWLVFSLDATALPVPAPDGNWLYWDKDDSGTRVAARVTPALTFEAGDYAHRNDAGDLTVDMPATTGGELLVMHEGKSASAAFGHAAPSGWTVIATHLGSFESARVLAKIATDSEPANFVYAVTGADDHCAVVTAISAPPGGWNSDVALNFADAVTAAGTSPIANPDNGDEQHRINFLMHDFFDVPANSTTTEYDEIYDESGEMNLSASHAVGPITGSESTFAAGNGVMISLRLVYNLAWRFWSLNPEHNNTYSGLRSRPWPAAATNVDGSGTYTGDRSNAAAWGSITLPNGESYAGNRGSFSPRVLFLDDGSVPR